MKVIENCDEVVGPDRAGHYWVQAPDGYTFMFIMYSDGRFSRDNRYIKADPPTFPKKKPPMPKWKWIGLYDGREMWAFECTHKNYWISTDGLSYRPSQIASVKDCGR